MWPEWTVAASGRHCIRRNIMRTSAPGHPVRRSQADVTWPRRQHPRQIEMRHVIDRASSVTTRWSGQGPRSPDHEVTLLRYDDTDVKRRYAARHSEISLSPRGATADEKLRGARFGSQHPTPRARLKTGLGVECGRGSPPPAVRVRGYHPRKFLKTQMLNPAFCNYLLWNFLLLENYGHGDQYIVAPNLKVGGPVSPGPYGFCAYVVATVLASRHWTTHHRTNATTLTLSWPMSGTLSSTASCR